VGWDHATRHRYDDVDGTEPLRVSFPGSDADADADGRGFSVAELASCTDLRSHAGDRFAIGHHGLRRRLRFGLRRRLRFGL
jgi:hypothetical protein